MGQRLRQTGRKDAILSLAGPAELGEDSPVLVLGAGLGEGAMAVAGEWLANVEGLVTAGPTAEKATARIAARGMSDTVSVTSYMPQNARLKGKSRVPMCAGAGIVFRPDGKADIA